jgi:hypothetical protein
MAAKQLSAHCQAKASLHVKRKKSALWLRQTYPGMSTRLNVNEHVSSVAGRANRPAVV